MIQKTKPFMAVSMPCTEKQFKKELHPILEFLGVKMSHVDYDGYEEALVFTNNYSRSNGNCSNTYMEMSKGNGDSIIDNFCPKTFIEALGYDYEAVLKAMQPKSKQTHYKVLRPILFFAKDNVVHKKTLKKYFTKKAIKAFINDEYIK